MIGLQPRSLKDGRYHTYGYAIPVTPSRRHRLTVISPEKGSVTAIGSVAELLAHAHTMEAEAAAQYQLLAKRLEGANPDLATFFHRMAAIEAKHVSRLDEVAETFELPDLRSWPTTWPEGEAPETLPTDRIHAGISAQEGLDLALEAERRAVAFFTDVAETANDGDVRRMATELAEEEREHVRLLQSWAKDLGR